MSRDLEGPRARARMGTREEMNEYFKNGGGGGGDQKPPTFVQTLKKAFDSATLPKREAAKALLRPLMDNEPKLKSVLEDISSGGLQGYVSARWVLNRYGSSQP